MLAADDDQAAGVSQLRPKLELADLFRLYGCAYRNSHHLPLTQLKVMRAIENCRTAALGGHIEQCNHCGYQRQSYNSCRNRHCPKCQSLAKARWLEDRKSDLLPVGYFHIVFTLPHELNPLVLSNKKVLCELLFKAVSETLLEFGRNNLGGKIGLMAVLHTWDQTLLDHFHLHCLIPAGALSMDQSRWIPARDNFLFSVRAPSIVYCGKMVDLLRQAFNKARLKFVGRCEGLSDRDHFERWVERLREKKWVVYAKKPFSSPERVLDYLGRYTHRVAISNNRIISIEEGRVSFSYRDRKRENKHRQMTLLAEEFMRRFLLHVLPDSFVRIRHYGLLANRTKKEEMARCRRLLGEEGQPPAVVRKTNKELMLEVGGVDLSVCPECKEGRMIKIGELPSELAKPVEAEGRQGPKMDSS
jgi:predicted Zn-ribbon and HTH transcriptional regulator